jgi:hypothetical protein
MPLTLYLMRKRYPEHWEKTPLPLVWDTVVALQFWWGFVIARKIFRALKRRA